MIPDMKGQAAFSGLSGTVIKRIRTELRNSGTFSHLPRQVLLYRAAGLYIYRACVGLGSLKKNQPLSVSSSR